MTTGASALASASQRIYWRLVLCSACVVLAASISPVAIPSAAAQARSNLWISSSPRPLHHEVEEFQGIEVTREIRPRSTTPTAYLAGSGLLGGAVGLLLGASLGSQFGEPRGDDGTVGGYVGAVVGESLLLPLGVHLANGARGSYRMAATYSAVR